MFELGEPILQNGVLHLEELDLSLVSGEFFEDVFELETGGCGGWTGHGTIHVKKGKTAEQR